MRSKLAGRSANNRHLRMLMIEKIPSIGLNHGEYGGTNKSSQPHDAASSETRFDLWNATLSRRITDFSGRERCARKETKGSVENEPFLHSPNTQGSPPETIAVHWCSMLALACTSLR